MKKKKNQSKEKGKLTEERDVYCVCRGQPKCANSGDRKNGFAHAQRTVAANADRDPFLLENIDSWPLISRMCP